MFTGPLGHVDRLAMGTLVDTALELGIQNPSHLQLKYLLRIFWWHRMQRRVLLVRNRVFRDLSRELHQIHRDLMDMSFRSSTRKSMIRVGMTRLAVSETWPYQREVHRHLLNPYHPLILKGRASHTLCQFLVPLFPLVDGISPM